MRLGHPKVTVEMAGHESIPASVMGQRRRKVMEEQRINSPELP
jgi:hypothetical protein